MDKKAQKLFKLVADRETLKIKSFLENHDHKNDPLINYTNVNSDTILHFAILCTAQSPDSDSTISQEQLKIIDMISDYFDVYHTTNQSGQTPIDYAKQSDDEDLTCEIIIRLTTSTTDEIKPIGQPALLPSIPENDPINQLLNEVNSMFSAFTSDDEASKSKALTCIFNLLKSDLNNALNFKADENPEVSEKIAELEELIQNNLNKNTP